MPKSVPKSIQTCFRVIFSKKILYPVFHGGSSFRKLSKFFFSKLQKCPKSFPKVSKHVLNMFWGKLFEKFLPSFPRNVESSKIFKKNIFKIPKMPKSVPKSIQTCFRVIFSKKNFMPGVPCRVEFSKIFKFFFSKFQKGPKSFPKVSKSVLNLFWVKFSEKFLPSFPRNVESSKIFKKNIFKIPKMPKSVPKSIQTCFRVIFSKKNLCPVFHVGSSFRKFSIFFFQNSKKAQNRSQKYPKVF